MGAVIQRRTEVQVACEYPHPNSSPKPEGPTFTGVIRSRPMFKGFGKATPVSKSLASSPINGVGMIFHIAETPPPLSFAAAPPKGSTWP